MVVNIVKGKAIWYEFFLTSRLVCIFIFFESDFMSLISYFRDEVNGSSDFYLVVYDILVPKFKFVLSLELLTRKW